MPNSCKANKQAGPRRLTDKLDRQASKYDKVLILMEQPYWAVAVHEAQGVSLDHAVIHLGNMLFCHCFLGRVRSFLERCHACISKKAFSLNDERNIVAWQLILLQYVIHAFSLAICNG